MIYLSLFIATFIASFGNLLADFPSRKAFVLLCLFIFFVVALRYASVDYFEYQRIYDGVHDLSKLGFFIYSLSVSTPVESGFALLIYLEKIVFGHYFIFIALFSLLSLTIKFTAFRKMSPFLLLSLLIYLSDEYFWKDIGQIRNAMASGIVLWALYAAYLRRFGAFVLLVYLAMLFHSLAIVAFPLYFFRLYSSKVCLSFAVALSLLLVITFGGVGGGLSDLALTVGFDQSSRIVKYADSQYATGIQPFGGTFLLQLLMCMLLLVFYTRLVRKWHINSILIPAYIYGSCLFFIFIDYGIIGSRIREMIAIPVSCLVIPSFVLLFRGYSRFLPYTLIVCYCLLWFSLMMRSRAPYQSILQFIQ